mgnify:CR=1 FL=1|tara:strand:- start:1294 stop:2046 length:753 start_codon:yes stop_codon:yes gene_type:complete
MASIEQRLKEELKRFKQIGNNANNLNEQVLGTVNGGSGFVSPQGGSPRISKFLDRQKDLGEQEEEDLEIDIPTDPEAATEELPAEEEGGEEETGEEDLEAEEEGGEDIDTETELDTTDGTEIDVTDLVSGQEEIKKEVEADKDMLSKNTEQLDSLLNKLEDLENQLGSMDTMVTQIEKLEQKIEKIRPKTQEEKLEARKYDSGPFSQSLVDFYEDNEDRFEKSGKDEYVLTGKDLENYNQSDIKQSFNVD